MYTAHHPCWDAKNRDGLEDELPFDYECIRHIFETIEPNVSMTAHIESTSQKPLQEPFQKELLDITTGMNSGPQIYQVEDTIQSKEDYNGIPQALLDLMKQNNVTPAQIQKVVAYKGYFPEDMPIKDYDPAFIQGVLIGAWEQVLKEIQLPF